MTRAIRDRILKDANGDIGDHLCNHIHLTNCIHLKNHIHKNSPIVADRSLMRDLVVLQRSRSLRDPSASPPSWHSPSIVEWKFRHIFRGKFEPLFSSCSYFPHWRVGGVENLSFDGVLWACNLLNVFFSAKK